MKWIIDVVISTQKQYLQTIRKEFTNINILPYTGLEIEDAAWKNPKKIISVSYNPIQDCVYIILEKEIISEESELKTLLEMYRGKSWEVLG